MSPKRFSKRGAVVVVGAALAIAALAPTGAQAAGLTVPQASQAAPVTVPHVEAQSAPPAAAPTGPSPAPTGQQPGGPSGNAATSESAPGEPMGDDVLDSGNYGPAHGSGPNLTDSLSGFDAGSGGGGSLIAALFGLPMVVSAQAMQVVGVTWSAEAEMLARGIVMTPKPEPAPKAPPGVNDEIQCPNGTVERVNSDIEDGGGADGCF